MKSETFLQEPFGCSQCETLGEISFSNFQKSRLNFPSKISIQNLPQGITESGIKNLFLAIGKPKYVEYFPGRRSSIVEFGSWNEAELAVRDLNNTPPYYLKVYMMTPKIDGNEFKNKICDLEEKENVQSDYSDIQSLDVECVQKDQLKKACETDKVTEENTSSKTEFENNIQLVLKSLNYDPSVRMRQKKLDYKSKWDCISMGRGYYCMELTDRFVGGLQAFSCSSGKLKTEVNYNCENCNALTTRICGNCSGSYCSFACLNNSVLDHKNSCRDRSKMFSKESFSSEESENDINSTESDESSSNLEYGDLKSGSAVVISTYCTLQTVFVRGVDDPLNEFFIKLSNDVAAAAMKDEKLPAVPKVGDLCIARYKEDFCFYRAKICSLEEDEATVIFIDYGNTQTVKVEELRVLPENLSKIPELAVKVQLKDVPKGSSLQAVNYFNKLTAERITLNMNYEDISQGVVLIEEDSRQVVNEKVSNYTLPSWKKDESVLSKLGEVFFMESLKLQSLEVGKKYKLCVSHFFEKEFLESGVFWATHVEADDFFHVKGEMRERVLEYCEYLKDDYYLPRVNELCLAKEKGEWHRCVNLRSHKTSCFLFFVDDGHSSIIETVNIRKIIKDFIEVPAQAVCCILSAVGVVGGGANVRLQRKSRVEYVFDAAAVYLESDGRLTYNNVNNDQKHENRNSEETKSLYMALRNVTNEACVELHLFSRLLYPRLLPSFFDDLKLKTDEKVQSKISERLKSAINQIIEDVQIDKFLGDVYCVSLPETTELH